MQARAQAALLSPDNFKFQTNATLAQSDLGLTDDITIDAQGSDPVSGLVAPQAPIEPDLSTLKLWMPFSNLGNQDDLALMGNTGLTRGSCKLVPGPPGNGNQLIGGTRAVFFDGYTSYLDVPDDPDLAMPATGGFSFCIRINITSYTKQIDRATDADNRTIACNTDDANNAWELVLSPTNGDILFHVKKAGTEYKVKSTGNSLNTWYDLVVTFAITGNVATIYKNNVASTAADTTASQYPPSTDLNFHIGRSDNTIIAGSEYGIGGAYDGLSFSSADFDATDYIDPPTGIRLFDPLYFDPPYFDTGTYGNTIPHSVINGGFNGALYDPRFYSVVLTSTQVSNLYANKFSISAITLGQSANAGYCLSKT